MILFTDKGKDFASQIILPLKEMEDAAFGKLSYEEQKAFVQLMVTYTSELKNEMEQL